MPRVATSQNGSGTSNTTKHYFDLASGRTTFTLSSDDIVLYWKYDSNTGELLEEHLDANTATLSPPTDFVSAGGGVELALETLYNYDAQGRMVTTTLPSGRTLRHTSTSLADGRLAHMQFQDYETSPSTKYYGPVEYTIRNHSGEPEALSTVSLPSDETTAALADHIDETEHTPVDSLDISGAAIEKLSVLLYDDVGTQLSDTRVYHDVPLLGVGGSADWDATSFGYDEMGRRTRREDRAGTSHRTITRTDYDELGRVVAQHIGTNDADIAGADNMTKVLSREYDGGTDGGDSYITQKTLYENDFGTPDTRVTDYTYDVRGNLLLETLPDAPDKLYKYDNRMRRVATGLYSSVSASDDPTTKSTGRLALTETSYDSLGRVYKRERHEVTGGTLGSSLLEQTWYDVAGRIAKIDGQRLQKFGYDRIGRKTHTFDLSADNDTTAYADALTVTGDTVLEEHQAILEADTGLVVLEALIQRKHSDTGTSLTGALDTDLDGDALKYTSTDITGRIQITAHWYDAYDRLIDTTRYGTNGGDTFDRDGLSQPSRSDTALRTTYGYDGAGRLDSIVDARGIEKRYEYDSSRLVKTIENYVDGTPSGADEDRTTYYDYTNGLRTKVTIDIPGTSTDRETTYTYGIEKGTATGQSSFATGHSLQKVTHPDSTGSDDVVRFAYNAQGEIIWRQSPATGSNVANVLETSYNDMGQVTASAVSTLGTGFDGSVRRIEREYESRGLLEAVTQYDQASGGSVVDEVQFTHNGWGAISLVEQDHDSIVGTGSHYEVSIAYETATNGRNSLRRTQMTYDSGAELHYEYLSASGLHDNNASRVTRVTDGTNTIAEYEYLGTMTLTGLRYPEPQVFVAHHDNSYNHGFDSFNRINRWSWYKDLTTDVAFYDMEYTYDRTSNVVRKIDHVHENVLDTQYVWDGLGRLEKESVGEWNGSDIINETRTQNWSLNHANNWEAVQLDLDGNGTFSGNDEFDDARTYSLGGELTARDINNNGTDDYTLVYDDSGNLVDDGNNRQYTYDGFSRLILVSDGMGSGIVKQRYNGLGWLIAELYDTDQDGNLETSGDDDWSHIVFDERGRITARYTNADTDPTEEFMLHGFGAGEQGGPKRWQALRDRDSDGNGTLDERHYYCQNPPDVVAIVSDSGELVEWVSYSAYGTPFALPAADVNSDGKANTTEIDGLVVNYGSSYDVRADVTLDGTVDSADQAAANAATLGWSVLSGSTHRIGMKGLLWNAEAGSYPGSRGSWDAELGPLGHSWGPYGEEYWGGGRVAEGDGVRPGSTGVRPDPVPAAPKKKTCAELTWNAATQCCKDGVVVDKVSVYVVTRIGGTGHTDLIVPTGGGNRLVGFFGGTSSGDIADSAPVLGGNPGNGLPGNVNVTHGDWNDGPTPRPGNASGRDMGWTPAGRPSWPAFSNIVEVMVCPWDADRMLVAIDARRRNPGTFLMIGRNCAGAAAEVLAAGGVLSSPEIPGLDTPQNLEDEVCSQNDVRRFSGFTEVLPTDEAVIHETGAYNGP